jgi:hypothetical protein
MMISAVVLTKTVDKSNIAIRKPREMHPDNNAGPELKMPVPPLILRTPPLMATIQHQVAAHLQLQASHR